MGLETEEVALGEIERTIAAPGRVLVAPNAQAIIGAKVTGRVVRVSAEPGQRVAAGQALVVVDSPQIADLRGQLAEARSRLALAEQKQTRVAKAENRSAAIQAKTRLDLAEANLERKRKLVGGGALPARDLQEAEAEQKNAKAEYDYQSSIQVTREQQEAEAEVEQARATVTRLAQSLTALGASPDGQGGTVVLASPIAGAIVARKVSLGETVTEDKELLTVMDLSSVVVEAELPESQASRVTRGQRLVARVPGVEGGVFEGQVEAVGDTVDPAKRTVSVRARVTNAGARLKHEMAVDVQIGSGVRGQGLTVPVAALVDDEGLRVVFVKEGETYERRPVTVGSISYGRAEILGGVEAGERVVTKGAYQLANMAKGGDEGGEHDDHDE
jgi:cobalt-zinc-cadmium efflux system membrane fusion protein